MSATHRRDSDVTSVHEIRRYLEYATPEELAEIDALLAADPVPWSPLPGPQTTAYESEADIIGYGGAAGGGKTDLACGKAITEHRKVMILRRVGTELTAINDRLEELLGSKDGYNGQQNIWRIARHDNVPLQIELGSVPNPGDERKFQGRPHDLIVFDEAANFLEAQVRFLLGWLRTTTPGQKCQALLTFNPPTSAEGRWIIKFFAPWLDPKHPNPAKPGELRWFATVDGEDMEVENNTPFVIADGQPTYDFDPLDHSPDAVIRPMSRTFIASRIADNPYLLETGYMSTLQSLPEPLRSQMLKGDFRAGMEDDIWQVIPTLWVEIAQARWKRPDVLPPMDSLGVDVARGGKDATEIARRHGMWFDEAISFKGEATNSGPKVGGQVISALRNLAPIHLDVIGVGASPYDFLNGIEGIQVIGVNAAEAATGTDKSGRLRFFNMRSMLWWRMREALDPDANNGIALPPDPQLLADLCAPKWSVQGHTIKVEGRDEIIKRIGRSPDRGTAYILALMDTPRAALMRAAQRASQEYDPIRHVERSPNRQVRDYNPLDYRS